MTSTVKQKNKTETQIYIPEIPPFLCSKTLAYWPDVTSSCPSCRHYVSDSLIDGCHLNDSQIRKEYQEEIIRRGHFNHVYFLHVKSLQIKSFT